MNTAWVYAGWTALLVGAVVVVILLRKRRNTSADAVRTNPSTMAEPASKGETDSVSRDDSGARTANSTTDTPVQHSPGSGDQSAREEVEPVPQITPQEENESEEYERDDSDEESSETTPEGEFDDVIIEASPPKNAFDLDSVTRSISQELWVSRWMLGEDACAELNAELDCVTAMTQSCLSETTVENGSDVHCPPDCQRLNSVIARLEEAARPLRSLRLTKYQHALAAMRADQPEDINPDRAAIRTNHEVSPDPTYGLHRLLSETRYGLDGARLEIARVSPTAGSTTSRRLRGGLTQATSTLRSVEERLKTLVATPSYTPTPDELLGLERSIAQAVWWRRFIEHTVSYLTAREWALTTTDRDEWSELADSALLLANLIVDLERDTVAVKTLTELGRSHVLASGTHTPYRTYRSIVETADDAIAELTGTETITP
ncbi:MAG: hypothetical protein Q4P71_04205 [Actinomycetaceae bacterium]|nr:hypothetical protein [Actinomycetaceae bacterium]